MNNMIPGILMTMVLVACLVSGQWYLIAAAGLMITIEALSGDVSMSTDHPLVKEQGLPL